MLLPKGLVFCENALNGYGCLRTEGRVAMAMMGMSWVMVLVVGLFLGGGTDRRQDPVAESKRAFDTVMKHLEPGGDVLLVLNTENFVRGLAETAVELATAATDGQTGEDALVVRRVAGALPGFLDRNGFLALQAVGASSVPDGGGIHRSKAFLLRNAAAAESPLWRGLVGGKPRALVSHTYWTEDVAWAASGTGEAAELWKVLRGVVNELVPEGRADFEAGLAEAGAELGIDVEALVASLGDEAFVALVLDSASTFTVPDLNVAMPTPGLLVGLRLKTPLLTQRLEKALKDMEGQVPMARTTVGDVTLTSVPLPMPIPFAVQPTMAYRAADGMLLLGSSTDVVRKALEAATSGKRRLLDSAAFAAELGGKAPANNGIVYLGRRFAKALGTLQQAALEKAVAEERDNGAAALLKKLSGLMRADSYDVSMVVNQPEGVQVLSRGTAGPERYLQAGVVAPVGVLAGLALPAIAKARQTAQHTACVNNLRILDSAKEQWALVEGKDNGAVPDDAAVAAYLRGGVLPVCPLTKMPYRLNAIGTNPECTSGDPRHAMPKP